MKKYIILFVSVLFGLNVFGQDVQKPTDAVCAITFFITDYSLIPEEGAEIIVMDKETKAVLVKGVADVEGKFATNLEEGNKCEVHINKFGKTFDFNLDVPVVDGPLEFTQRYKIRLVTRYIRTYTLENVYFDVDKFDLRKDSHKPLMVLFNEMKANPKMKIELAGHTDSDGDDNKNMILSQNRANSVMNFLVNKGIENNRIVAKGYGETSPIADNDTPAGKQKNRRTEVRVIEE
jgi:outer membrane protein OmpA-like peptidoglycan-associated protein